MEYEIFVTTTVKTPQRVKTKILRTIEDVFCGNKHVNIVFNLKTQKSKQKLERLMTRTKKAIMILIDPEVGGIELYPFDKVAAKQDEESLYVYGYNAEHLDLSCTLNYTYKNDKELCDKLKIFLQIARESVLL